LQAPERLSAALHEQLERRTCPDLRPEVREVRCLRTSLATAHLRADTKATAQEAAMIQLAVLLGFLALVMGPPLMWVAQKAQEEKRDE
jgi:hypothetical protein